MSVSVATTAAELVGINGGGKSDSCGADIDDDEEDDNAVAFDEKNDAVEEADDADKIEDGDGDNDDADIKGDADDGDAKLLFTTPAEPIHALFTLFGAVAVLPAIICAGEVTRRFDD